jgi:hypothetical protein
MHVKLKDGNLEKPLQKEIQISFGQKTERGCVFYFIATIHL